MLLLSSFFFASLIAFGMAGVVSAVVISIATIFVVSVMLHGSLLSYYYHCSFSLLSSLIHYHICCYFYHVISVVSYFYCYHFNVQRIATILLLPCLAAVCELSQPIESQPFGQPIEPYLTNAGEVALKRTSYFMISQSAGRCTAYSNRVE